MDEPKDRQGPESGAEPTIVQRRAKVLERPRCPRCGTGWVPGSQFCIRCGTRLPEIEREEPPETAEQRRPSRRALNWFVDLVPGAVSL